MCSPFLLSSDFTVCTESGWLSPVVLESSFSTLNTFLFNSLQQVFGPPEQVCFLLHRCNLRSFFSQT